MWTFADRLAKTVSDLTIGTVIVLVHVALADREAERSRRMLRAFDSRRDGRAADADRPVIA